MTKRVIKTLNNFDFMKFDRLERFCFRGLTNENGGVLLCMAHTNLREEILSLLMERK